MAAESAGVYFGECSWLRLKHKERDLLKHKPLFSSFTIEGSRFLTLLLVLFVVLVVEPIAFGHVIRSWVFDAIYTVLIVVVILVLFAERRIGAKLATLGMVLLCSIWLSHSVSGEYHIGVLVVGHVLGILFLLLTVFGTVRSVLSMRVLGAGSLYGAVAGYLLLGTAWGTVYSLVHLLSPGAFDFGDELPRYIEAGQARIPLFLYYSFVTLTTLGFGDMTPITQTARTLSWVEAVTGLFYISVLVAGVVGVYVSSQVSSDLFERADAERDTPRRPGEQSQPDP